MELYYKDLYVSQKSSIFATQDCKGMQDNTDIFSLEGILSLFFDCFAEHNQSVVQVPDGFSIYDYMS